MSFLAFFRLRTDFYIRHNEARNLHIKSEQKEREGEMEKKRGKCSYVWYVDGRVFMHAFF